MNLCKIFSIIIIIFVIASCNEQKAPPEKEKLAYEYYSDGTVAVETQVKDSLAHGLMKKFNRDGSLDKVFTYNMGQRQGPAVEYFPNGQLRSRIVYKNNMLDGPAKVYYKTGELYRESIYKDGKLNGVRKYYYKSGKIMAESAYKNGFPAVGLKEYNGEGKEVQPNPKIIIDKENNLAFNNTYSLKIRLSEPYGKTMFYIGDLDEGKYLHEGCWPIDVENGVGEYRIILKRGEFRMETLSISAKITTKKNNELVINRKFNLAIDNK